MLLQAADEDGKMHQMRPSNHSSLIKLQLQAAANKTATGEVSETEPMKQTLNEQIVGLIKTG